MRAELVELAGRQHGAFSLHQALRYHRDAEIRRRLDAGEWHRVCRGVFCASHQVKDTRTRLAAIQLAFGEPVVACLHTAAELHGFGVVASAQVHVVDPVGLHRRGYPWLAVHQRDVPAADLVMVTGFVATAPARTAIEVARGQPPPRALAVLDAALRSGVPAAELSVESERQAKRRGIVHVRKLLPLADPRAESPMESAVRLLFHDSRLPAPEPQFEVVDPATGRLHRLDLAWPARKVALEYDGVEFHTGAEAMRRDRARHNWLVDRGWTVIYATADDVLRRPWQLVRQVWRALTRVDHGRHAGDRDQLSACRP